MVNEQKIIKLSSLLASALSIDGAIDIPKIGRLEVVHNRHTKQKTMDGQLLMIPPSKSVELRQEKSGQS